MVRFFLSAGVLCLLAVSTVTFLELQHMGFPDGHLTELERAQRPLFYAFLIADAVFGLIMLARLFIPGGKTSGRALVFASAGYGGALAAMIALNIWFQLTLNHGIGG